MASSSIPAGGHGDPTRRDFLMVASGAMAAVGAIATAWPFINNLNPAADVLALSQIEVNVKPIAVGQAITKTGKYKWYPMIGGLVMTVALVLLATVDVNTSKLSVSLMMVA